MLLLFRWINIFDQHEKFIYNEICKKKTMILKKQNIYSNRNINPSKFVVKKFFYLYYSCEMF